MKQYDKNPRIAGIFFLLGFAGSLSAALLTPLTESGNITEAFLSGSTEVQIGASGILIMGFACTGIAVALYPVLRKKNEGMALGAVVFRGIEGALHILIGITYLGMLAAAQMGEVSLTPLMYLANTVIEAVVMGASVAFGIGAILYYLIFFWHKLVPAWLALWGLSAMTLSLFATVYGFFFDLGAGSVLHTALNIPIALQELVLAGWLIGKGFRIQKTAEEQVG